MISWSLGADSHMSDMVHGPFFVVVMILFVVVCCCYCCCYGFVCCRRRCCCCCCCCCVERLGILSSVTSWRNCTILKGLLNLSPSARCGGSASPLCFLFHVIWLCNLFLRSSLDHFIVFAFLLVGCPYMSVIDKWWTDQTFRKEVTGVKRCSC